MSTKMPKSDLFLFEFKVSGHMCEYFVFVFLKDWDLSIQKLYRDSPESACQSNMRAIVQTGFRPPSTKALTGTIVKMENTFSSADWKEK